MIAPPLISFRFLNTPTNERKVHTAIPKGANGRTFGFLFASGLARVISEDLLHQFVVTLLELIDDSVVQGILVLLEPAGDVVGHLQKKTSNDLKTRSLLQEDVAVFF